MSTTFLSRGIDYLGEIGTRLRDLQGYRTLAHELIQNADDVETVTSMTFDVRNEALVVDNDGVFSDCRQVEQLECPWKEDGVHGHRCDFHRFRKVASGDKRSEKGTTGAFGIGFISVYQVTDRPELISAERHWVLHEDRPEGQRIESCPGCRKCRDQGLPGTRFILPWARDPGSPLRKALGTESISHESPELIIRQLEVSLPVAMLFLRRLRVIEIRRHGQTAHRFERMDERGSFILTDGDPRNDRVWHVFHSDFRGSADVLRLRQPGRIEPKRSAVVTVAIPATDQCDGLLCAYLPTEQNEGLPFHINADFFTTNDRKRVIFEADYQSEWNREALRAAARAMGAAVPQLPRVIGAKGFWHIVSRLKEIADKAGEGRCESSLAEFWNQVATHLRSDPVIPTTKGELRTATETHLLLQKNEAEIIPVLEALAVHVVDENLRSFQGLLRSESVGVSVLDVQEIARALSAAGLDRRTELKDLPAPLDTEDARKALWTEIATLLQRPSKAKSEDEERIAQVALAPGRDSALWPCREIYHADELTIALFGSLDLGIAFVKPESVFSSLNYLCQRFDANAAVNALSRVGGEKLETQWKHGRLSLQRLFAWFEDHRAEIVHDQRVKSRLGALSIFPTSGALRTLGEIALPGNFNDPLGLAELVDLEALDGRREFLKDLGMAELNFDTYASSRLPVSLSKGNISLEKRREVVLLLAGRLGELKDNEAGCRALAGTPLVECQDGTFRCAKECYFDSDVIRDCLGASAHFAVVPQTEPAAITDFYQWLGVSAEPRFCDVVARILELSSNPYSQAGAQQIQKIVAHLGKLVERNRDLSELTPLRTDPWLPARGRSDRWYAPGELYAAYQAYLFESQAVFVDLPATVQNASRTLLEFLGILLTPPVGLVVKHLLNCVAHHSPVNSEVYRFLNDKAEDPALCQLKDKKCLWLGNGYYTPRQVFWGNHRFGPYRQRLGEALGRFGALLSRLDVRYTPTWEDALSVLREIASDFGSDNRPLDEGSHTVLVECWRTLAQALDEGIASPEVISRLRSIKCVPNASRILNPPEWMFFENRAGLSAKFDHFIDNNVIPRPIGTGRALDVAGVQALGTAVRVELLECEDPVDDPAMAERVRARRIELARVIEAFDRGSDTAALLNQIDGIGFQSAGLIEIRYQLNVFNRELHSAAEQVPALYQADQRTILFTRRNVGPSWAAIARELAIALSPDEDPGRFAAGFKEVLAPESLSEASTTLDELGFAKLDASVTETPGSEGAVEQLGTETPIEDSIAPGEVPGEVATEEHGLDRAEAVKRLLGPNAPQPTTPAAPPETDPSGTGNRSDRSKGPQAARKKGRPVLRSYVPPPESGDMELQKDAPPEETGRAQVDQAGIRRVLSFELEAGRVPKEMPHTNPGFDVESRDATGTVVRYIEVKSLSGKWSNTYAVLSRPQFEKASDLGELFWLYVVERTEGDDFHIYPIQNPALRANHFMFDDGWRATAESVPATQER